MNELALDRAILLYPTLMQCAALLTYAKICTTAKLRLDKLVLPPQSLTKQEIEHILEPEVN